MKTNFLLLFCIGLSGHLIAQSAFEEITETAGVKFGGQQIGVAFSDYDRDGDDDFYVSLRDGANYLFENLGNNNFINVAAQAGLNNKKSSRSSLWVDINNDGYQDLYICSFFEGDDLYLNNGDKTFTNITRSSGIDNIARPFSVNAADVNGDGWLDIYVANFQTENILYLNNKDNTFTNIAERSGATSMLNAMGAVFFDYDKDNDQDLYLTHDGQPYILYNNIGGGNFIDVSEQAGVNYDGAGMGVDVGDINNDGWMDIYITNLYENTLYLNNGDGTFTDISHEAAVDDYGMGWGTNFLDYNNDGKLDIYVNNDSYFSPYPNVLYENQGDTTFTIVESNTALASMQAGYGSACSDINLDGSIDLVVVNAGRRDNLQLFSNQTNTGNWIGFKLEGVQSNKDAVGARIELISTNGMTYVDEVTSGSGYASQNALGLHFGLGEALQIQSGNITWPSGVKQEIGQLDGNNYYKIIEGETPEVIVTSTVTNTQQLSPASIDLKIFPNPTTEQLQLEFLLNETMDLHLNLMNSNGQILQSQIYARTPSGWNTIQLKLKEDLPQGNYQLQVSGDGFNFTQWVSIMK